MGVRIENFYKTFGIQDFASDEEIKKAFRDVAKKYHPDNTETGDIEKFRELEERYRILSHPQSRSEYDSALRQNQIDIMTQDNGISFGNTPTSDFFKKKEAAFDEWFAKQNFDGKQSGNQQFTNQTYDDVAASFVNSIFDDVDYIMGTDKRYELEKEIQNIKFSIEEREKAVRQFAVANNPYNNQETFVGLSDEVSKLIHQLSSLRKKESDKVNESINLHNRIAYQMFPKRFESVENVLRQQLEEIRAEKDKLESRIEEKRKEAEELRKKLGDYPDECIKSDSELLQLREQLKEKQQQLDNLRNPHRRR